jgi:hypothetical protein
MAIDVGYGAAHYEKDCGGVTISIDKTNTANATGTLDTFQVYYETNATNVIMGTCSKNSATSYTARDSALLGNITAGAVREFTGLSVDVQTGDYLGQSKTGSYSEKLSMTYLEGDGGAYSISAGATFSGKMTVIDLIGTYALAMYATGTETAVGGQPLKNVFGRPFRGCFR